MEEKLKIGDVSEGDIISIEHDRNWFHTTIVNIVQNGNNVSIQELLVEPNNYEDRKMRLLLLKSNRPRRAEMEIYDGEDNLIKSGISVNFEVEK